VKTFYFYILVLVLILILMIVGCSINKVVSPTESFPSSLREIPKVKEKPIPQKPLWEYKLPAPGDIFTASNK